MGTRLGRVLPVFLLLCATLAQAQGPAVRGRVSDVEGLALPGVVVSVRTVAGMMVGTTTTDGDGRFGLATGPGSYRLRAELPGFRTTERPLTVTAGEPIDLSLTMALAAFEEEVTVKGEAPHAVLGDAHPDAPATVTRDVVDSGMLPNSQYDDVLPLLPNVVRGPDGTISIAGAEAPRGALRVNGGNLTDPTRGDAATLLPLEAVD